MANDSSPSFETNKFELATYIAAAKGIRPLRHGWDWAINDWFFVFPISQEQADEYESEYVVSAFKTFNDMAGYFKKSKGRNPRRWGDRS